MPELKELANSLEKTLKDSDLHEVATDLTEVLIDNLIEDGIVKDIPIIGTVVGLRKVFYGIKEQLFLKKIIYFISEVKDIPADKRKMMIDKIDNSKGFRTRVGEKLLYIIDRCEDHEKAQIIARLFAAFIHEKITYQDFLQASSIVERIMIDDLRHFIKNDLDRFRVDDVGDLMNTGLFYLSLENPQDRDHKAPNTFELRTRLSEIGGKMRVVLENYKI